MRTKIMSMRGVAHGLALLGALACADAGDAPSAYEAKLDTMQQYAWITELSTEDAVPLLNQMSARSFACKGANVLRDLSQGEGARIRERAALLCVALRRALPEAERVLKAGLRPAYAFTVQRAENGFEPLRVGPFEERSTCEASKASLQGVGIRTTECDLWR